MSILLLLQLAGDLLRQIQGLPGNSSLSWQIEEASLYWDRGEQTTGKHLLKSFIDKLTKVGLWKDKHMQFGSGW